MNSDHNPFVLFSTGLLIVVLFSLVLIPGMGASAAILPGNSYYPILVPLDSEQILLFFTHVVQKEDFITDLLMQTTLTHGTWSEAAPLTTYTRHVHCYLQGVSFCRLTWYLAPNNTTIYLIDVEGGSDKFYLKTYWNGTWSEWREIIDHSSRYPVLELQTITDSKNQLHMVWEQFHWVELGNGSDYGKHGLFYSTYQGNNASRPESIDVVEYRPGTEECPACGRHFLAVDPMTDRLYLAWFNGGTFFTSRTLAGWMDPIQVDTTPYSTNLAREGAGDLARADLPLLDFHIDSQGALYFFFSIVPENDRLLLIKYKDGQFSSVVSDQSAPFRLEGSRPVNLFDVELDSMDTFHLAYIGQNATGAAHLYYQTFKDSFSPPIMISKFAGSDLDLALDPTDTAHLAWTWTRHPEVVENKMVYYTQEIFYAHQTEEEWSDPIQVTHAVVLPLPEVLVTTVPGLVLLSSLLFSYAWYKRR